MRKLLCLIAAFTALGACSDDGHISGDDPTRNDEGPGEGRPMDSNPAVRERAAEPQPSKERAYATDGASEQTTAAPPEPE